jgi:uncharacterized protein (DUF433 family)
MSAREILPCDTDVMRAEGESMLRAAASLRGRIVQDPKVMVGKPVVQGTRIPVERVLAHLADTPDLADLFEAFPRLTLDDVRACLEYARDVVERQHVGERSGEPSAAR